MWLHNNSDEVDYDNGEHAVQGEFAGVAGSDNVELLFRHLLVHDAKAVHQRLCFGVAEFLDECSESARNQQDREKNDAEPLNEICPVGSLQAAQDAVKQDDQSDHGYEQVFDADNLTKDRDRTGSHQRCGDLADG